MSERRVNQQNAVNTWYLRFVQNLETEYYAELVWDLIMMGRATAEISITIRKLLINRYKDEVLKAMLTGIANRDPDMSYSDRELGEMMVGARKLGLAWPELVVMERSLGLNGNLDEAQKIKIPDTEKGQLALVRRDPYSIAKILNPSELVQIEAVSYNGYAIQDIKEPSEAVKIAAVERNGSAIQYIKDPSEAVKLAAVNSDASALGYIRRPSKAVQDAAVSYHPYAIRFVRNPSPEMQLSALSRLPDVIPYISRPSLEAQILVMRRRSAGQIMAIKKIDPGLWNDKKIKDKVLKMILRDLRDGKTGDAVDAMKHLTKNSCPWPELNAIEKSLRASNAINEADDERDEYIKHVMAYLKSYLLDRQYYDTFDFIQGIADMDDVPHDLKPLFDQHKHGMMTSLLKFVKHTTVGDYISPKAAGFDLATTLDGLRNLGVDWPELKGLEKSVNSGKTLKEARFDAEERKQALEYVEELPEVAGSPGDCMYVFQFFHGHEMVVGPSLKQFFDPHRDTWIRFLLENMREGFHYDTDELYDAVRLLRRIGIRWPELDVIEKSLNADMDLKETIEIPKDLDAQIELIKNHPWMISNMWAPAAELQRIVLKLDGSYLGSIKGGLSKDVIEEPDIQHNIIKYLLTLVKQGDLVRLGYRLEDLRWKNVNWPEIKAIHKSLNVDRKKLNENEFDLVSIDDVIQVLTNGSGKTLSMATDVVVGLDDAGKAALRSAMVQYKSSIMANLLDMYFIPDDKHNVDAMNRLLRTTGIDWPEVSNLPKSLELILQRELEDRMQSGPAAALDCFDALHSNGVDVAEMEARFRKERLARMIRDYAKDPSEPIYNLANDITAFGELGVDPTLIRTVLEARKDNLIRALLNAMKGRNYQDANTIIDMMRDFGIEWKELDVFERSLSSGTLEESDTDDRTRATTSHKPGPTLLGLLQNMVDELRLEIREDGLTLALRGFLYKLQDRYELDAKQIDALLAPIMGDLVDKLNKDLSGRGISIGLKDISHMSTIGLNIAPLVKLVRANKSAIMRFMLTNIKEKQSTAICLKYVEMLERMGIDWPEFTAIRRANSAEWQEIKRRREEQD